MKKLRTKKIIIPAVLGLASFLSYVVYRLYKGRRSLKPKMTLEKFVDVNLIDRKRQYSIPRNYKIVVVSYNVQEKILTNRKEARILFQLGQKADIYVIGLQEINMKIRNCWRTTRRSYEWNDLIESIFSEEGYSFVSFGSKGGLYESVWIKTEHVPHVSKVENSVQPMGEYLSCLYDKGAVFSKFRFYETDFLFCGCHFYHGKENLKKRNKHFMLLDKTVKSLTRDDLVFVLGDLNYRIDADYGEIVRNIDNPKFLVRFDQLTITKAEKKEFSEYQESEITFSPTYKLKITDGKNVFVSKRNPSFTDRILWKRSKAVRPLKYFSLKDFPMSDHRPVIAIFEVEVLVSIDKEKRRIVRELMEHFYKIKKSFE